MALKFESVDAISALKNYKVMLYGDNGSGKTHFSGTWPNPVFLVHKDSVSEVRTLQGQDIAVLTFDDLRSCLKLVAELQKAIRGRSADLPYLPRTLVFDNLTVANELWMEELESAAGSKVERDKWGQLRSIISAVMRTLHSTGCHVIWIAHPSVEKVTDPVTGKDSQVGRLAIKGAARDLIPGIVDLLLYAEATDTGSSAGVGYRVHLRKRGIWPAKARLAQTLNSEPISCIGPKPSPCYDLLAPALGLPSRAEEESKLNQ